MVQVGRAITDKWQNCVVTIEVVTETHMSMFGSDTNKESKSEVIGTVIDPSGLTVTSLTMIDPMAFFNDVIGSMAGGSKENSMSSSTKVTSVKLFMPDGKAVPAQIVLRDKDLDLAFIRPLNKLSQPIPALDLAQTGEASALDNVIFLSRLGQIANRSVALYHHSIVAVVEKPRKYYVIDGENIASIGPVFTQDGRLIGLIALRRNPVTSAQMNLFSAGNILLPTILPAATIADIAKQAPEGTKTP